jgi:hypothetical protein
MWINKTNRDLLIEKLKEYVGCIPVKKIDESSRLNLVNTVALIKGRAKREALYIECDDSEIETLLYEYLKMLDKKQHLAIVTLIDRLSSVESIPKINEVCKIAAYYKIYPTTSIDSKIKILVAFLTDSSGLLDVDFAIKNVLKS